MAINLKFNEPQRQSKLGILILFGYQAQNFFKAFWPLVLVVFFKGGKDALILYLSVFLLVVILGTISYLKYWYFTFYIDYENEEFIIHKGVINKTKLNIPLEKIQQVNMSQNILHKVAQVYKVVIDTAGSKGEEVSISALSLAHAKAFKDQLQQAIQSLEATPEQEVINVSDKENLQQTFKISFSTLVKIGLTSKYKESISLLIIGFFYVVDNISRFDLDEYIDENEVEQYFNLYASLFSAVILVCILIAALLIFNLVRTVLKYFNYQVFIKKDSVLFKYGLIKTKEIFLKPYKVQIFIQKQNWFQKKLKLSEVYVEQAKSGNLGNVKEKLQIPGVNKDELDALKLLIFNHLPEFNETILPNYRKWLVPNVILGLIFGLLFWVSNFFNLFVISYLYYLPILLLITFLCYMAYRNSSAMMGKDYVQIKGGIWDIDYELFENTKIQGIETQQYIWQKPFDIGSVTIYTAGGNLNISTYQMSELMAWVNYWLYKTESHDKKWM